MFPVDYTYAHYDDKHTSIIDHFIVSKCVTLSNAFVLHSIENMSGHSAIFVHLLCPSLNTTKLSGDEEIKRSRMAWHKASNGDLQKYKIHMDETFNTINLDNDIHECNDLTYCKNHLLFSRLYIILTSTLYTLSLVC